MKKHFEQLLNYTAWANSRLLVCLQENKVTNLGILRLYSHLISAQIIWLLRIQGLPTSPFPVWEEYKINELESMTEESSDNWSNYLKGHQMETFEEMIHYKDTKGKSHESTIREIIGHVINHSTYHRGQIAFQLRALGIAPPPTDFIVFQRL